MYESALSFAVVGIIVLWIMYFILLRKYHRLKTEWVLSRCGCPCLKHGQVIRDKNILISMLIDKVNQLLQNNKEFSVTKPFRCDKKDIDGRSCQRVNDHVGDCLFTGPVGCMAVCSCGNKNIAHHCMNEQGHDGLHKFPCDQ